MSPRRKTMAAPRPTSFERRMPYARRQTPKTVESHSQHSGTASGWNQAIPPSRSASPPLNSVADMAPRLAPRPQSSPMQFLPGSRNMSLKTETHPLTLDAEMQNRLQKLSSKRDRQKQAKEDDYAVDPTLVQVTPLHACARCKSQKWKCYILADPNSPRRTCLPCGKNKCTFGGSKSRPMTLPPPTPQVMAMDDVLRIQRPCLKHTASYDHALHGMALGPEPSGQRLHGFGHHRSNSGHMHSHPPPLYLRPLASPFPSPALHTPELSPSSLTDVFPSPLPRTPLYGYFDSTEREVNTPVLKYEYGTEDKDKDQDYELERAPSPRQSVIHLIPSERLRPIPLPSPTELLSHEGSAGPVGCAQRTLAPVERLISSSPLSSAPTSPRLHAHKQPLSCPSSPHCPPSPLFPLSPKQEPIEDLVLPPIRSSCLHIPISQAGVPMPVLPLSPLPALGSSPATSITSASSFEHLPPTNALLSLLCESAARDPNDPRPERVANDMLGVSEQWVSHIQAARRKSLGAADKDQPHERDAFRYRSSISGAGSSGRYVFPSNRTYVESYRSSSDYERERPWRW